MKRLSDKSVLTIVNEYDAENFAKVVEFLDYTALLPEDLGKLYEMHHKAISPHLTTSSLRVAAGLYVLCFKHLALGTASLFRLYSAQAWRETRAAVEAAGVAHAIQTNPDYFKIFKEDDGSEKTRKVVRNTFKSNVLFPSSVPALEALKTYYDIASQLSHTNTISFVQHLGDSATEGQRSFSFQDIQPENIAAQLPKMLFWTCQSHLAILVAADNVFPELPADMEPFRKQRSEFFQKLNRFSEKHKSSFSLPPSSNA
jgi:hypothetical protein